MATPLADRPAGDRFTRQTSEVYRGHKLTVKKGREWGFLHVLINGHTLAYPYGTTNGQALRELRSLRGTVDDSIERPDAYDFTPDSHRH